MGIPIRSDGHLSKREWASVNHCNRTKIYFFPYISATPCRRKLSGIRIRCKYVLTRNSKQQLPKRQRSSYKSLCKCLSYVSAFWSSAYEVFDILGAKITLFLYSTKKQLRIRNYELRADRRADRLPGETKERAAHQSAERACPAAFRPAD